MTPSGPNDARLAIDIGGTFTDVVVKSGGRHWTRKVLTTQLAPEAGVIEAIGAILDDGKLRPADIGLIIHGTTLATNALIERKGARTALLATAGFRDTIELGTESRFDQYDVNLVKRAPLVPRHWRIPIVERVAADGEDTSPAGGAIGSRRDRASASQVESKASRSHFFTAMRSRGTSSGYARCCRAIFRACRSRCRARCRPKCGNTNDPRRPVPMPMSSR